MNTARSPTGVTKLEAATRQLRTAVRLFFEEADCLSVHSLAAAVHAVLRDLSAHAGSKSMVKPPGYDKRINFAENFLKHANEDPSGKMYIDPLPELTQMLLFDACVMLQGLARDTPFDAKVFWAWYMVTNEQDFADAGPAIRDIIDDNRHLREMTFVDIREFLRANQLLDTSEPVPPWALLRPVDSLKKRSLAQETDSEAAVPAAKTENTEPGAA